MQYILNLMWPSDYPFIIPSSYVIEILIDECYDVSAYHTPIIWGRQTNTNTGLIIKEIECNVI